MDSELEYLAIPLPEDILKLKYFGDIDRLNRVIDLKIASGLPRPLEKRLQYEKHIMSLWASEYPYTQAQAIEKLTKGIQNFAPEEIETLRDTDAVEWTYINGQVMYKDDFFSNLIKTRKEYASRVIDGKKTEYASKNAKMLNDTIRTMQEKGKLAMRFHMRSSMQITSDSAHSGQKVVAQLPLPMEYAQVKNVHILSLSHPDALVAPPDFPARTVRFCAVPDKAFCVEYTYETHMKYQELLPERVSAQQPHFFTEEQPPHIVFTPFVRMMAEEIVGEEKNPLLMARKIYDYITTKNIYSYMRAYWTMPNVPEFFLSGRKGDCGVQALTFITLCRAVGIPARWQSGLEVSPLDVGSHDWTQFYVSPYGWLFADPSFGGGAYRAGDFPRWNFYFGHLDPYRLPANAMYQQSFYLPMKQCRYDPYDSQQGEAEYEDMPVPRENLHTRHEALSIEALEE